MLKQESHQQHHQQRPGQRQGQGQERGPRRRTTLITNKYQIWLLAVASMMLLFSIISLWVFHRHILQSLYPPTTTTTTTTTNSDRGVVTQNVIILQRKKESFHQQQASTTRFVSTKNEIAAAAAGIVSTTKTSTTQENRLLPPPKTRYVEDSLCSHCRFVFSGPTRQSVTCIFLMRNKQQNNINTTEIDAARSVAQRHPLYCGRCDPNHCSPHEKRYWALDAVAPTVQYAQTHYLTSIPPQLHRLAVTALSNLTEYVSHAENLYPAKIHLFEFNPSIIVLPTDQIPAELPQAVYLASYRVSSAHACIQHDDGDDNENDDVNNNLLALRFARGFNATSWSSDAATPPPPPIDYVAFALLDAKLRMVAETVVDALPIMHRLVDARLFVLHQQIYIGSYQRMHPIWVIPPPPTAQNATTNNTTNNSTNMVVALPVWPSHRHKNPTATNNSHSVVYNLTITFRSMGSCTNDPFIQKRAKNLNYFVDANNRTILEVAPMAGKEVVNLSAPCIKAIPPQQQRQQKKKNKNQINQKKDNDHNDDDHNDQERIIRSNLPLPHPTFATMDELEFAARHWTGLPPYTDERGGACCLEIPDPRHQQQQKQQQHNANTTTQPPPPPFLLLGIAHRKTRFKHVQQTKNDPNHNSNKDNNNENENENNANTKKSKGGIAPNHFFSNFYVMESIPPYHVIRRTGHFCLGWSDDVVEAASSSSSFNNSNHSTKAGDPDTAGNNHHLRDGDGDGHFNPYAFLSRPGGMLRIGRLTVESCPRIHFVSGMSFVAHNHSQVILAYGINDCVPRMIVVELADIVRMLFAPEEMW